jgi:hypothetical protein
MGVVKMKFVQRYLSNAIDSHTLDGIRQVMSVPSTICLVGQAEP